MISDQDRFISAVSICYQEMKLKMRRYCQLTNIEWDEDVFSDTIVKCYNTIEKQGNLQDNTSGGCLSYLFKSFVTNIKRDKQYARQKKKDDNSNLQAKYEDYLERTQMTPDEKVLQDTKKDFSIFYVMLKVQEQFDDEHFHLFNLKHLGNLTYKQLQEKTKAKAIRQKVSTVKKWIKENISKEEIDKAFDGFMSSTFSSTDMFT